MRLYSGLTIAALLLALWPSRAQALFLEGFEGYADTPELEAAWVDGTGSPVQTLETSIVLAGSQALRLDYDLPPFSYDSVVLDLGTSQDWSAFDTFTMWVHGDATNSVENVGMGLASATTTLGQSFAANQSIVDSWQQLSFDLSGYSSLTDVRFIAVGLNAVDGGTGTVYFDDLSIIATPEPGSALLLGLGLWILAARRRR